MMTNTSKTNNTGQKGSVILIFILALPIVLGSASLMVDFGYSYLVKADMQTAADAAALAGVYELAADNAASARAEAIAVGAANPIAGGTVSVSIDAGAVEVGRWSETGFIDDPYNANAVKVTMRRTTGSPDGPLPLFFGPSVGLDEVELEVSATAKLAAVDLTLVLDTSSSMTHDTYYRYCTRWLSNGQCGCGYAPYGYEPIDTLREAAISFVDDFDEDWDQLSVISYYNLAVYPIDQNLTDYFWKVEDAIEDLPTPNYCYGTRYTNIGDAMSRGIAELESSRARASTEKIMVVLSDGRPTCTSSGYCNGGSSWVRWNGINYAMLKARTARDKHITIFSISLGNSADRGLMQYMAEITGGEEFFAESGDDLDDVFESIRSRIPIQLTD
ncbi:MAG: Flp pilus assembly protein TadG [Hyphomicrobiaceae bacterium]|jgi:Flp pilus assembly protein TadG